MNIKNESVTLSHKIDRAITTLPNPSQVLKSKSATMDIFQKVARHPDVFPQIASYQSALCGLQLVTAARNKSIDEFFTQFFNHFSLRNIIPLAAAARDYGFAVLEVTEFEEYQGRVVPSRIELCPNEYFFFDRERRLRMKSNAVREGIDVMTTYPGKYILLQNKQTLTNPYGVGLLDVAFWIAVGLNGNFEFLMQFCEDDGRDKWVGHYPPGASNEEISDLLSMLMRGRNNGVSVMPVGMDVEIKPMTGRSSTNNLYKDTDEMLRRKIEKLWTGTDLTMQVDGKGGDASSGNGLTIREDALQEGITLVYSAIRQIAQIVVYLNNMPELPDFSIQLPRSISKTIAETDKLYYDMGMRPTKRLLLKRGYSEDDFILDEAPKVGKTADFAALPSDFEPLLDVFDAYRERLKKK